MPIYFVIVAQEHSQFRYAVWNILEVVECDISDVELYFREKVVPLQTINASTTALFFRREPPNPFKTL